MYGIIYKATNKINGKIYIGQTIRSLKTRKKEHLTDGKCLKYDTYFYKAINKYGKDAFIFEKIDEANSREELDDKEIYWVKHYDSFRNGYNSTFGGSGSNTTWNNELIELEIRKIMEKLGIDYFPTQNQLIENNLALSVAISKRNGTNYWSKLLDIKLKKEVNYWNDELIEQEIIDISNKYFDGKTMPNCNDLFNITNSHSLGSAISKGLGYTGWANKLNLKLYDSVSNFGLIGQVKVKNTIENMGNKVEKMKFKETHSLLVNDSLKIFVSCANPNYRRNSRMHRFKIKSINNSDINVFCAFDDDGNIENYFIIPHSEISHLNNTLDIGKSGKYYLYLNKWDFIQNYEHENTI